MKNSQTDSVAVEQCILGGLLLSAWQPPPAAVEAWEKVKFLAADEFSEPKHRLIFSAIKSLADSSSPFDLISLWDTLEQAGRLKEAGGQEYLAILGRDTPSATCIDQHAKILHRKSLERERLKALTQNDHALAATITARLERIESAAKTGTLPVIQFTHKQLITPPPSPRFIIDGYMPADVWGLMGTGGTGKSTLWLQHCIHLILGTPLWGMEILSPGPVVYVTAEDSANRILWRLFNIVNQMGLPSSARQKVTADLYIVNLVGTSRRLAAMDGKGNITPTSLPDQIIEAFSKIGPVAVSFDPMIKFGPGERHINDGEDAIINAMMRIMVGLNTSVGVLHHVSKFVFRNSIVDHHAGRGGSALGDDVRAAYQLETIGKANCASYPGSEAYAAEIANHQLLGYTVTKLTDAQKPDAAMILRRNGWLFERVMLQPQAMTEKLQHDIEQVADYLFAHREQFLSRRELENLHADMKMGRNAARSAIQKGLVEGVFSEAELPTSQRRGQRKTFIFLTAAEESIAPLSSGAIDA